MNYKTLLMASAAVLFSTQAMAQDLTGAFSVPGKGQITSETTLGMTRESAKFKILGFEVAKGNYDARYATEVLEYGITDNLSVNAGIKNFFDTDYSDMYTHYLSGETYNNDHNFAYDLGAKYNMRFDDLLFQVAGRYETYNPKDFWGHQTEGRWQKSLGLDLKAGLDLGNGITPYIVYSIDSAIDTAHRPLAQSVSAGVHKYAGKWALDGAIRYEWTKGVDDTFNEFARETPFGTKNTTETWLDIAGDYYLRDNVALGIYGSYLIDAHNRSCGPATEHTSTSYELGLRVKVLF